MSFRVENEPALDSWRYHNDIKMLSTNEVVTSLLSSSIARNDIVTTSFRYCVLAGRPTVQTVQLHNWKTIYWGKDRIVPFAHFLVGWRGRFRLDSVGRSVSWRVGLKVVGPLALPASGALIFCSGDCLASTGIREQWSNPVTFATNLSRYCTQDIWYETGWRFCDSWTPWTPCLINDSKVFGDNDILINPPPRGKYEQNCTWPISALKLRSLAHFWQWEWSLICATVKKLYPYAAIWKKKCGEIWHLLFQG